MNDAKDVEITEVIFRKYRKAPHSVVAIFPYEIWDMQGNSACYEHVGQHGACDYSVMTTIATPATKEEYAPLLKELESMGYNLKVLKRMSWSKRAQAIIDMAKRR